MSTHFLILLITVTFWGAPVAKAQTDSHNIHISLTDSIPNAFGFNEIEITYGQTTDSFVYKIISMSKNIQVNINDSIWKVIPLSQMGNSHGGYTCEYLSGESEMKEIVLFSIYYSLKDSIENIINNGGIMRIQYCFTIISNSIGVEEQIYSNILEINMPALSNDDISALTYIIQQAVEFPELEYITSYELDPLTLYNIAIYESIIQIYPNSTLGKVAKASLALNKCRENNFEGLPTNIKTEVQQTYNELYPSPLPPIRKKLEHLKECLVN